MAVPAVAILTGANRIRSEDMGGFSITAGIGILKTAFDIAKGLKDIDDATGPFPSPLVPFEF
jgi:hypothetical protein